MNTQPGQMFARRLRQERGRAGFSQAELAKRMGEVFNQKIYASAITRIENCERAVRLDEAVVLAELLHVPLAELLYDSESAEERIGELERDLSLAEWRASQAADELEQAQREVARTRSLIAELQSFRLQ